MNFWPRKYWNSYSVLGEYKVWRGIIGPKFEKHKNEIKKQFILLFASLLHNIICKNTYTLKFIWIILKKATIKKTSKFYHRKYWNSYSVLGEYNVWRGILGPKFKKQKMKIKKQFIPQFALLLHNITYKNTYPLKVMYIILNKAKLRKKPNIFASKILKFILCIRRI